VRRAQQLFKEGLLERESLSPALKSVFEKGDEAPVAQFLDHDDSDLLTGIKRWQYGADPILADLSRRFLGRGKFRLAWEAKSIDEELAPKTRQKARDYFEKRLRGSAEFYFIEDHIGNLPYDPEEPVWLLRENGKREDLARRSQMIRFIMKPLVHARYYVPAEHGATLAKILGEA
jgi:hypothetical protein